MLKNYLCCRVLVLHFDMSSYTTKNLKAKFLVQCATDFIIAVHEKCTYK